MGISPTSEGPSNPGHLEHGPCTRSGSRPWQPVRNAETPASSLEPSRVRIYIFTMISKRFICTLSIEKYCLKIIGETDKRNKMGKY